ncbi:ASCH domain-containing protein [Nocardioides alkalitolerans]|uniref:ASCH domain-containing protein n=1 Tax=Nocardioides alkalitolerans TaxID=281714 RepID=UPI0006946BB9|nr:ASCH domain-containing protein [Nocardioides alkalitolerans]
MAGAATGRVALFSIHPRYADAILAGTKTVEFRRQGLPDDVTHIVIYSTAPVQRIVGMFEIDAIDKLTPARAWKKYGDVGAIEQTPFERYYTGAPNAYVIRVRNPLRFVAPVALADLDPTMRPPQSYMYLTAPLLDRLTRLGAPGRMSRLGRAAATVRSYVLAH